jgi:hypothetical protein
MIFLWAFGSAIETRIGALHFITVYFICIFASNVFDIVLLNIQSDFLKSAKILGGYHSLGASGAISGIMGLFVVRCFFARLSVSVPFFFLPFISLPIRVQGTLLIGIFFAMDLSGSMSQFVEDSSQIDYWAHVGGYLTGFALGYLMRLHIKASEESIKVKAERLNQKHGISENTTDSYTDILKKEPENEPALRYFFELHKYNHTKAESYFVRLIQVLTKKEFKQALELFNEHFPNFLNELPGDVLFRLGLYFFKNADLYKARTCLEFASEKEGIWQAKAMITLAQIFESIGNDKYAKSLYNNIANRFTNSVFEKEAKERLLRQKGICG